MCSLGTPSVSWARSFNRPPFDVVMPIVLMPALLAYSTALTTFLLLPLPLIAMSTSPHSPYTFSGSTKTAS